MAFAEALRSRGGIENRSAVLRDERKELFRGKDLLRWVKAHPDKSAAALPAGGRRRRCRCLPASARRWPCACCLQPALSACFPTPQRPAHPPAPRNAGKGLEGEQAGLWLGAQLLRRRLAVRVDRASYKPLPNSKKLVKFPKRIVPLHPSDAGVSRVLESRVLGLSRAEAGAGGPPASAPLCLLCAALLLLLRWCCRRLSHTPRTALHCSRARAGV